MKNTLYPALCVSFLLNLGAANAQPAPSELTSKIPSGEQTYKQACVACHASGVAKAPKLGDKKAWTPLIAEGQHVLTAHAWVGVRGMPPKGGRSDLSLEDFANATAFMARSAGGKWADVDSKMLVKIRSEERLRLASLKAKK
jgi:cytochrome c5